MNLYGITKEKLESIIISLDEKKYRAKQLFSWFYNRRIKTLSEIDNMNKEFLNKLQDKYNINRIKLIEKQEGKDVTKYLFMLEDGCTIESVLMIHNYGNSLCVSTQVGCNMNCLFCESGKLKKRRNLEVYEMTEQVLLVSEDKNARIDNVVLMGIGEPLDNYDNVIDFIKIINHHEAFNIGIRHITVSTCGIIPKIKILADANMPLNLAISLHAPNDEIRNKIMPINKVYPINELIEVIKKYINKTNRRVSFEYIMLEGINDSQKNAKELAKLLSGINGYVNLIPYNVNSSGLIATKEKKMLEFYDILKKEKINVTIRCEFGSNVDAACGQLSSKHGR